MGDGISVPRRRYSASPHDATREERFWLKVDRSGGPDACWPWTAGRTEHGYGVFWDGERFWKAQRYAWALTHGDPGPLHVLHRCDNPPCVNWAHLFLGSHRDNMRDMIAKGRDRKTPLRAAANGHALLTWQDVDEIRRRFADGERKADLAREFGTHRSNIRLIVNGETWREEWRS